MLTNGMYPFIIYYDERDPVIILDKNGHRVLLDDSHKEYYVQGGEIVLFSFIDRYSYTLAMQRFNADGMESKTEKIPDDMYQEEVKELENRTLALYEYIITLDGVPLLKDIFFETKEDAQSFLEDFQTDTLPIEITMIRKDDYL